MSKEIKAIQTFYKGYKFRSRLEARWAVFFDALGLKWEYEPEGYELPDGSWYLPDFRINSKYSIEIKPLSCFKEAKKPSAYMAGTMRSGQGWRGVGVTDRENRTASRHENEDFFAWSSQSLFDYLGPSAISCDHGCSHGEPHLSFSCGEYFDKSTRQLCVDRCFDQILRSDIFAIYIDRADLYGSLVEIGFAKAAGKKIWFGICPSVIAENKRKLSYEPDDENFAHELWFAQQLADEVAVCKKENARDAFDKYLMSLMTEEQKQAAMIGESHVVFYGDPVDMKTFSVNQNIDMLIFGGVDTVSFKIAATKARQARFEHGEKP